MRKFLTHCLLFLIIGFILGEGIVRAFKLYIDVPTMYVDESGLIKANPNQDGLTIWGHKWVINRFGEYGYEPKNLDSLYTIIGDSYIANTINPPECHQARFLSTHFNSVDFYPAARGGAGFLEFITMANELNDIKPIQHLLYVHHGDFVESIMELENNPAKFQWSYETKKIRKPYFNEKVYKMKRIMYSSKFFYYIYRNYLIKTGGDNTNNRDVVKKEIDYEKIRGLLAFVDSNYDTSNITLIFSPDSDPKLTNIVESYNYKTFTLKTDDYKSWQFENDSHWNCFGHEEVSAQVANFIKHTNFSR